MEKVKRQGKLGKVKRFLRENSGSLFKLGVMSFALLGMYVPDLWAWSQPTQGSFAYDVYDIAINKIAKGPIGFVAGAGLMAGAIFAATRAAWVPAVLMAVGSGTLFKIEDVVSSLGYLI